jgi:uncharacterized protein
MTGRYLPPTMPLCPVTVVVGPPAAGKSTYVASRATGSDVVIDLDDLALALSPPGTTHHTYPIATRRVAIAARQSAIDRAISDPAIPHLWIIHAWPSPAQLRRYGRWCATIVLIDPGEPTVRARAQAGRPRRTDDLIDAWYRNPPAITSRLAVTGDDQTDDLAAARAHRRPLYQRPTPAHPSMHQRTDR